MALLAYNLTGAPLALAAGSPVRTLPASPNPPSRGPAVNVTTELRPDTAVDPTNGVAGGVSAAGYVALQAQSVAFEWTSDPEYLVGALRAGGPGASDLGVAAVVQLVQGGQPTTLDTLTVGADTYEVDGVGANINFALAGTAALTLDALLAAAVASGTENLFWDKLNATTLRLRAADGPQGNIIGSDPSIVLDASSMTNYTFDAGNVNMNTLAGKAAGQSLSATTLTITAAMVAAGSVRISAPFTPTGFQVTAVDATGAPILALTDTLVLAGDDLLITLNGGVGDLAATDVVHVVLYG